MVSNLNRPELISLRSIILDLIQEFSLDSARLDPNTSWNPYLQHEGRPFRPHSYGWINYQSPRLYGPRRATSCRPVTGCPE